MFRLRWEIRPGLAAGRTVIAAPYLETAIAFGRANGLPADWLRAVFRFAPAADACYRAEERRKSAGWKKDREEGFAEFSSAALAAASPAFDPAGARRKMIAYLDAARDGRKHRRTASHD